MQPDEVLQMLQAAVDLGSRSKSILPTSRRISPAIRETLSLAKVHLHILHPAVMQPCSHAPLAAPAVGSGRPIAQSCPVGWQERYRCLSDRGQVPGGLAEHAEDPALAPLC